MNLQTKSTVLSRPTLVDQVFTILQDRIVAGVYPPGSQLPIEEELVKEFNTSRTTIRGSVDRLISKHLVVRKHGIGTFVASVPKINDPLNIFIDFQDLIRKNGHKPGYQQYSIDIIEADESLQKLFDVKQGEKILEIMKYWTADGDPVVYCENHIPLHLVSEDDIAEIMSGGIATEPIFHFFDNYCKRRLEYYVASLRSDIIKHCRFDLFLDHYSENTSMLIIDELGYTKDGVPIHHSIEYHPDNIMNFSITRRRE